MSDTLEQLVANPQSVFSGAIDTDKILQEVKTILDPITKDNSVLDEIYVDGLVSSQVWGQVKLVIDGVNENVLFGKISSLKEQYGDLLDEDNEDHDDEAEGDSEQDEDEDEDEEENGEEQQQESELDEGESEEEYFNAVDELEEEKDDEEELEEPPKQDKFGLNDKFFSIDDFNKATTESKQEDDEYHTDKTEIDLYKDLSDNDNESEGEMFYDDYYKAQKGDDTKPEISNSDPDVDFIPEKDAFGLNDQFFSIDDFNKQVLAMENDNNDDEEDDEEDIDLFADLEDEDDDEMYEYGDFFKAQVDPKSINEKKSVKFSTENDVKEFAEDEYDEAYNSAMADFVNEDEYSDEDEVEEEDEADKIVDEKNLSTFEKQQMKIKAEIEALEKESISAKKWTMKGEASVKHRDADGLLDEELEFDRTARPVPVITQETTESLEEIIKRRIKDEKFDEVQRRIISDLSNFKNSKRVEVSEEKSTKSLAELYEDDYSGNAATESTTMNEELQRAHDEISDLFTKLNYKLDSLCSAHFVPKPKEKMLDIKVQTSTISMEDAQPLTLSNAETLAPQEIYRTRNKADANEIVLKSGVVMARDELDRDEKQRLRRAKKRKIHNKMKEKAEKKQKVDVKQY
ncbi:hypothetical protein CANARDRAFT_27999 [[Candida] arabinofermentans NRRL YB-2248]|uniref:U3 small nucleolar ribonucleoprotein protein MPP10 n=1 Tax=[Candida] arabinofermentans NRRL YB-2248 TaxID=983967 RepID=A0A1E4T2H2_9ASCO|nr:hypothetical protein CANARDRAFT_27999 [[Candida] arabinofermentans NRRL YB-2248]